MPTIKRPAWVLPGQQWGTNETYEQYKASGKTVNPSYVPPAGEPPVAPIPPKPVVDPKLVVKTPQISSQQATGAPIEGFPQSSDEYDQWKQMGRVWDSATNKWYEASTPADKDDVFDVDGAGGEGVGDSGVARRDEEQKKIDWNQFLVDQNEKDQQEIDRLTVQEQLKEKRIALGLDPDTGAVKPPTPQYESSYDALRAEHGMEAIETRMNDLDKTLRDMEASLRQGLYDEEGELKSMELIGIAQRELQRQGQEQLDTIRREKQTLIDEYNTKVEMINTKMNLKQMDYNAAKEEYNQEFNTNLKLLDIIKADEADELKSAQANWSILSKAIETGFRDGTITSMNDVPNNIRMKLREFEVIMGIPAGSTEALLAMVEPDKDILQMTTSSDKTQVSVIYEDGTTDLFNTGLTGGTGTGGLDLTDTQYNKALELSGLSKEDYNRLDEESQRWFAFGNVKEMKDNIEKGLETTDASEIEKEISEREDFTKPMKDYLTKYLKSIEGEVEKEESEKEEMSFSEDTINAIAKGYVESVGKDRAIQIIRDQEKITININDEEKSIKLTEDQRNKIIDIINSMESESGEKKGFKEWWDKFKNLGLRKE